MKKKKKKKKKRKRKKEKIDYTFIHLAIMDIKGMTNFICYGIHGTVNMELKMMGFGGPRNLHQLHLQAVCRFSSVRCYEF